MLTKIEWAEETWNPVTGCTPISEGCQHCYAKRMANRLRGRFGYPADDPFRVTFHPDRLDQPLHWKKPRRIFVCSMGDLFHEDVSFGDIDRVFNVMTGAFFGMTHHTYLLLTKRPQRILEGQAENFASWPNIWLGVTAENQKRADERIPVLRNIPAAKRFVSIEPMLGPVELDFCTKPDDALCPHPCDPCDIEHECSYRNALDWVIVGGETGPGARPMDPDWARSVRDQCQAAGVPFFMKQMSGTGAEKQRIPVDLQIRKYPA